MYTCIRRAAFSAPAVAQEGDMRKNCLIDTEASIQSQAVPHHQGGGACPQLDDVPSTGLIKGADNATLTVDWVPYLALDADDRAGR